MSGASWIASAFNFLVAILVARELGPEAFGLYALAIAVNEFINIIMGFGIAPALVQSRDEPEGLFDTGYAMSFGLGLVGVLIACAVAPFVWIHRSELVAIFLLLLSGARIAMLLNDVALARLDRSLRYGPIAVIDFLVRVPPGALCLGLAWAGFGPWSLIVRDLLMAGLSCALAHLWSRYRFGWQVTREAFRKIMDFSAPVFVARTLDVFLQRFDRLVVGAVLGNAAIGVYHQSRFLSEAGLLATSPIAKVTFNLYSRVQCEPRRLARSYSLVNYFLVRILFGGVAALLAYPEEIVRLLLGDEWTAVAPPLRVLALYAALCPIFENVKILLLARAMMGATIRLRLVQLVVFVPGVVAAGLHGSLGAVAAVLLGATVLGLALGSYANRDVIGAAVLQIYALPSVLLAASVGACWLLESGGWMAGTPWWSLPFLPALLFWSATATTEGRRLLREIRYLRSQLGGSAARPPASP